MAENERQTKAEKREQKRRERLAAEEAAKKQAGRDRVRNAGIGVVAVALVAGMVYLAVDNTTTDVVAGETITVEEGEQAMAAAGCEPVAESVLLEDRTHFEPTTIPPAETIYTGGRPTNSGPHYTNPSGVVSGASDNQLEEFATTHNLEHGAIIAWYDPAQVEDGVVDEMDDFVRTWNDAGFEADLSGAGIFASPYEDPGIDSGKPIALRAWGVSMDCDSWDDTAAQAFVIDNYGTNGTSPERDLGPYPVEALGYSDVEADAPSDTEVDPSDMGSMSPADEVITDGATDAGDPSTSDAASEDAVG